MYITIQRRFHSARAEDTQWTHSGHTVDTQWTLVNIVCRRAKQSLNLFQLFLSISPRYNIYRCPLCVHCVPPICPLCVRCVSTESTNAALPP